MVVVSDDGDYDNHCYDCSNVYNIFVVFTMTLSPKQNGVLSKHFFKPIKRNSKRNFL